VKQKSKLVHNEQTKLTAAYVNGIALAVMAVACWRHSRAS
jgi:hypothetical protein